MRSQGTLQRSARVEAVLPSHLSGVRTHCMAQSRGGEQGMKVNIVITFQTEDGVRILNFVYIEENNLTDDKMESILRRIRTEYGNAEMADDDIRELDRKAKFDPTVL